MRIDAWQSELRRRAAVRAATVHLISLGFTLTEVASALQVSKEEIRRRWCKVRRQMRCGNVLIRAGTRQPWDVDGFMMKREKIVVDTLVCGHPVSSRFGEYAVDDCPVCERERSG